MRVCSDFSTGNIFMTNGSGNKKLVNDGTGPLLFTPPQNKQANKKDFCDFALIFQLEVYLKLIVHELIIWTKVPL